jgi:hypothetical protein
MDERKSRSELKRGGLNCFREIVAPTKQPESLCARYSTSDIDFYFIKETFYGQISYKKAAPLLFRIKKDVMIGVAWVSAAGSTESARCLSADLQMFPIPSSFPVPAAIRHRWLPRLPLGSNKSASIGRRESKRSPLINAISLSGATDYVSMLGKRLLPASRHAALAHHALAHMLL